MAAKRSPSVLARLSQLHAQIDADAQRIATSPANAQRLKCKMGCSGCCSDGLTVWNVEAERIRQNCAPILASEAHPAGKCAFLDKDTQLCRIYEDRPYVCRTQGLPLRFLQKVKVGSPPAKTASGSLSNKKKFKKSVATKLLPRTDICELNAVAEDNENMPSLRDLKEEEVWSIGPVEMELLDLQEEFAAENSVEHESGEWRVPLRSLFKRSDFGHSE